MSPSTASRSRIRGCGLRGAHFIPEDLSREHGDCWKELIYRAEVGRDPNSDMERADGERARGEGG